MSAAPTKFSDVTVAVTCYNHQSYIEQCLDSIEAQTWIPRQVIVIDDASKDDSAEVIRHWLQKHQSSWSLSTHVRNRGVCTTLNEALKLADSRFFCHVSGDDWEVADRFERQSTDAGWNDPSTALLVGDIREVGPGGATLVDHNFGGRLGHITGQAAQDQALSHLLVENVIPAPGVLLRTDLVRRLGGFDEDLAFEDYDMWLRLSEHQSIAYTPGIVANYRLVDSGLTRNKDRRVAILNSEAAMLVKHIGRSPADDDVISRRLVGIAGDLLKLDAGPQLRRVLSSASSASPDPRIRLALTTSRLPGGLARLRKNYPRYFTSSSLKLVQGRKFPESEVEIGI